MKFARVLLASCACLVFVGAHAGETVPVFGLPLGGTLKSMPKACSADKPKEPCWDGKPANTSDGDLRGPVKLPSSYTRPGWAVSSRFYLRVQKDAKLLAVTIKTASDKERDAIVRAVNDIVGQQPDAKAEGASWSKAKWEKKGGSVYLLCLPESCEVDFQSAELRAKIAQASEKHAEREAARRAEEHAARRKKLGLDAPSSK